MAEYDKIRRVTFTKSINKPIFEKHHKNPIDWVLFLLELIGRGTCTGALCAIRFTFPVLTITLKLILFIFLIFQHLLEFVGKTIIFLGKAVIYPLRLIKRLRAEIKFRLWLLQQKEKKKKIVLVRRKTIARTLPFPTTTVVSFFATLILFFGFYFWILKDLPSPNRLVTRQQTVSTKLYDRRGRLLYTIYNGSQNRFLITLNQVPKYLQEATIATEDRDYYHHQGFSPRGIARAIERNVLNHQVEGGSTITQQLIKNTLLTNEKTITRKIKEVVLAVEVELLFTKDEILQMYFNEIPYGGTAYGAEAASKTYFGKSAQDLDLAESALLAGLPSAPTTYSPFGANPRLAFVRQKEVLQRMVEDGYITRTQANEAANEKLEFAPQRTDIEAPHFVMYIKDLLVKKYGIKTVEEDGLEVVTSIDLDVQKIAQDAVAAEIDKLEAFHVTNGAALVTDPKTGEILAMVGSKDYFDTAHDGNVNVATSLRQPGSSIKVVNYAVALQSGYTPASVIQDTPVVYRNAWETYAPVNYDGRFHGNVSLRIALASSYNIPAVKVLASYGVDKMVQMGRLMGITSWNDPSRFGLSLTLGGGEVTMTDMATVYGTLANMGKRVDIHPVLRVTDYKGRVLENYSCSGTFTCLIAQNSQESQVDAKEVIPAGVAYLLTNILSDNSARTPAFGPNSQLVIPGYDVAVKTGTTNEKRDNWTIGYTPDYVVTVWVGNNDNSPMSAVASGVTGASPIWHNIITAILKDKQNVGFTKPDSVVVSDICAVNGLLACEGCPSRKEVFITGTQPKNRCDTAQIQKIIEEEKKKAAENQLLNNPSPQPH